MLTTDTDSKIAHMTFNVSLSNELLSKETWFEEE